MRVLYKEPGKVPEEREIPNELKDLQNLVGGYIETVRVADSAVLIMNEEGKLRGLEPNFILGAIGDIIVGPVVIVGTDGEDFCSLTSHDAEVICGILRGGFEV